MSCSEWTEYRLEEVIEEFIDYRGRTPKKVNLGIPLITAKIVKSGRINTPNEFIREEDYESWMTRGIPKKGDVILTTEAPLGEVAQITSNEKIALAQRIITLRSNSSLLDNTFLKYLLQSPIMQWRLSERASGTTVVGIKSSELKKVKVNIPSLEKQKKIANILSSLDDKIELNNEMNNTLEEMAQSIFKRWFVDFEFPNEDGQPYKSSGGEMVESELGMIPKGWKVKNLDEIANYLNGLAMQRFRPSKEDNESLPVLKIKELKQGATSNDSDRCSCNIDDKYIINDGDVIFAWSGSLDVRIWCGGKAGLNQHLFKVTSKDYPKWFYYLWSKRYLDEFIKIAEDRATTMGHIKRSNLSEAKVLVPNQKAMEKMGEKLSYLIELFIQKSIEIRTLGELRNTLLPKLMSGKINI